MEVHLELKQRLQGKQKSAWGWLHPDALHLARVHHVFPRCRRQHSMQLNVDMSVITTIQITQASNILPTPVNALCTGLHRTGPDPQLVVTGPSIIIRDRAVPDSQQAAYHLVTVEFGFLMQKPSFVIVCD